MKRVARIGLGLALCAVAGGSSASNSPTSVVCRAPGQRPNRVFLPDCGAYTLQATSFSSATGVNVGSGLAGGVSVTHSADHQVVQLAEQMDQWNIQLNSSMRLVCDMIRMHPCDSELHARLTEKQLEYSEKTAGWRLSLLAAASDNMALVRTPDVPTKSPLGDVASSATEGDEPDDVFIEGEHQFSVAQSISIAEGRAPSLRVRRRRNDPPLEEKPQPIVPQSPPAPIEQTAADMAATAADMAATAADWAAEDEALLAKYDDARKPPATELNVGE